MAFGLPMLLLPTSALYFIDSLFSEYLIDLANRACLFILLAVGS